MYDRNVSSKYFLCNSSLQAHIVHTLLGETHILEWKTAILERSGWGAKTANVLYVNQGKHVQ